MDLYILHNNRKIGPFSNDATQTLLRQGTVSEQDLAWRPGLSAWQPLGEVLGTASDSGEQRTPPPVPSSAPRERITGPQMALLHYLEVFIPTGLSKDGADALIAKAKADPAKAERMARWKEERTRLHPGLFAAETEPALTDRVQLYLEKCRAEGAQYFTGVTKAHCQVLLAFLDVNFPRWDARETEAMESYFFPAIAQKFPQLVNKAWRGRFRYREGMAGPAGAARKSPTAKLIGPVASPAAAIFRGILLGVLILGTLYLVYFLRQGPAGQPLHPPTAPSPVMEIWHFLRGDLRSPR